MEENSNWTWEDWFIEPIRWLAGLVGIDDLTPIAIGFVLLALLGLGFLLVKLTSSYRERGYYPPQQYYQQPQYPQQQVNEVVQQPRRRFKSGFENVDPRIYDFSVPSSTPNLENLRKPPQPDWDLAATLFAPSFRRRKK